MPKYVDIWDISLSLRYNMDSDDNLQFKALFKNMFVLFIILGACGKQNLFTLKTYRQIPKTVFQKVLFL